MEGCSDRTKNTGTWFLLGLVVLIGLGVAGIAKLARGIVRESVLPHAVQGSADATLPPSPAEAGRVDGSLPHLSPASRAAIQRLICAIAAQIGIAAFSWLWALRHVISTLRPPLGIWTPIVSGVVADLPYAAIVYSLLRKPGRRTFAYALTVPGILIPYGFVSSFTAIFYFVRMSQPLYSLALLLPWALHILIFYLAWKAIRQIGIHPDHRSLLVSALVVFLYFSLMPFLSTIMYLFAAKVLHG
jgi:hypothetical protein